jgi:hypothetical protein
VVLLVNGKIILNFIDSENSIINNSRRETPKFSSSITVGDSHPSDKFLGIHFRGALVGLRINNKRQKCAQLMEQRPLNKN